jgi:phage-related baseplate assembly protein
MTRFLAVDLEGMSPPDIIETIDFEDILAALKTDMSARMLELGLDFDVQDLESDPAVKILEVAAAREVILRARVNGAAKALLLALAQKMDLEHLGAWFGVERLVIEPAVLDDTGAVVTPAVMEDDERLRRRIQLAPQAFSTAGPIGAYEYHVLTAAPTVKSVGIYSPRPGHVYVYPLVSEGNGTPDWDVLQAVRLRLQADDVRPLTDQVTVMAPGIVTVTIEVELIVRRGPDAAMLVELATERLQAYADARHKVGAPLRLSGIYQAAHITDAVENVIVAQPEADVDPGPNGAVYVEDIIVRAREVYRA